MELLAVLRLLWDHRAIVTLGIVLALGAALVVGLHGSAGSNSGVGRIQLLLDTTDSQLVTSAPKEADTLPKRAVLLADLLESDEGRASLARSAGVPEEQVVVFGPSDRIDPPVKSPLVTQASAAASVEHAPFVVNAFASEESPIITIESHAPNARRAADLAKGASTSLRTLLVAADGTQSRGFVLEVIAPLRIGHLASASNRRSLGFVTALAVFSLWCGCVVLVAGTARKRRRTNLSGPLKTPLPVPVASAFANDADPAAERNPHSKVEWAGQLFGGMPRPLSRKH